MPASFRTRGWARLRTLLPSRHQPVGCARSLCRDEMGSTVSMATGLLIPFSDNNRHLFQTVGPRCCAAIIPGGAAAPPYPLHRLSLGIGITDCRVPQTKCAPAACRRYFL